MAGNGDVAVRVNGHGSEDESSAENENPLFNPLILNHVLSYAASSDRRRRELRLVCSTWNVEIMKRFQKDRIMVRRNERRRNYLERGVCITDGIEVLKYKSINPFFTKFIFDMDVADPLVMQFLILAGEHTEEVSATYLNTPESIRVLRDIMETFPNLTTLGVDLIARRPPGFSEDVRARKRTHSGSSASPDPPAPAAEPQGSSQIESIIEAVEALHLFPAGAPLPVYPNLKHITFHAPPSIDFEPLARQLLLSAPNLDDFDCSNGSRTGTVVLKEFNCGDDCRTGTVVHLENWFFRTVVMNPDFPTLAHLKALPRDLRIRYTDLELKVLTVRGFPLTRLVLNLSQGPSISVDVLESLFKHLGSTLRKLDLSLSSEDRMKAGELSRTVLHLTKLEELVATDFHLSLGSICAYLTWLRVLKIQSYDATVVQNIVPKSTYRHPLRELCLTTGIPASIPTSFINNVERLFPGIKYFTLDSECIENGNETLVDHIIHTMKDLEVLFFVRDRNVAYLQAKKGPNGQFRRRRFNELGVVPILQQ